MSATSAVLLGMQTNDTGARPLGARVLLRRDDAQKMAGNLHLPDGQERWEKMGTILAVGPDVKEPLIQPGVRVIFQPKPSSALLGEGLQLGPAEWERCVILPEEHILAVLEDDR